MPNQDLLEVRAEVELSEKVFTSSPNIPVLCLTVIGLIKIYTRFEKVTTLADNFLAFICVGYFVSTVFAYLALRAQQKPKRLKPARIADLLFWRRYVAPAR